MIDKIKKLQRNLLAYLQGIPIRGIIILKSQDNNTTAIKTFEDFILTVYVVIDDLYHQFALSEVTSR